jgi:hypothetical protein
MTEVVEMEAIPRPARVEQVRLIRRLLQTIDRR